nr:hypothetical protein CFP56_29904 [Quercus suber]
MLGSTGVSRAATSSVDGVEGSRHSSGGGRVVDGGIDSSGPDEVKWDGSSRGNHWRTRRHHEKHAGRALCISEDALGGNGRRDSRACTRAKKRPRTGSEAVQLAQPPRKPEYHACRRRDRARAAVPDDERVHAFRMRHGRKGGLHPVVSAMEKARGVEVDSRA